MNFVWPKVLWVFLSNNERLCETNYCFSVFIFSAKALFVTTQQYWKKYRFRTPAKICKNKTRTWSIEKVKPIKQGHGMHKQTQGASRLTCSGNSTYTDLDPRCIGNTHAEAYRAELRWPEPHSIKSKSSHPRSTKLVKAYPLWHMSDWQMNLPLPLNN